MDKEDKVHRAREKSLADQVDATQLMYEEQVHQLMQENHQLIEETNRLKEKNKMLDQLIKNAHIYTQVDSLQGNVDSISRSLGSLNSSIAVVNAFNDLRDDVSNRRVDANEAWKHLESAATGQEREAPCSIQPTSQVLGTSELLKFYYWSELSLSPCLLTRFAFFTRAPQFSFISGCCSSR